MKIYLIIIGILFIFGMIVNAIVSVHNYEKEDKAKEVKKNILFYEPVNIVSKYILKYIKDKNIIIPQYHNEGIKELKGLKFRNICCVVPLNDKLSNLIKSMYEAESEYDCSMEEMVTEEIKESYPQIKRVSLFPVKCFKQLDEVALITLNPPTAEQAVKDGLKEYYKEEF